MLAWHWYSIHISAGSNLIELPEIGIFQLQISYTLI